MDESSISDKVASNSDNKRLNRAIIRSNHVEYVYMAC